MATETHAPARRLARLVDYFVPEAVRSGPHEDAWGARTLVATCLFVGVMPPLTAFINFAQGQLGQGAFALLTHWSFLSVPFLLRATGSYRLAGHLTCALGVLFPFGWMLTNGGVEGAMLPLFVLAPTAAVVLIGKRAGAVWATISISALGGLLLLPSLGLGPTPAAPEQVTLRFANTALAIIALWGLTSAARVVTVGVVRALMRARDELGESNARLLEAQAEVEAASLAKGRFLASVSHELRTPMNGVIGFTDLLLDTEQDPERRAALETIQRSGRTMIALVNDVLDYTKLEVGAIQLEKKEVELSEVCADAVEIVAQRAHGKRVEVAFSLEPQDDLLIRGDPVRIGQILVNLLGNAVKFTERGVVRLRVNRVGPGRVRFEVSDTGIGIEPEAIEHLFEPFSQADASTTRRYGGSGLGLSIVRALVASMGGALEVASEVGVGSTFSAEIDVEIVRAQSTPPIVALDGRRVAVRAQGALRDDLQVILRRLGLEVVDRDPDVTIVDQWHVGLDSPGPRLRVRRFGWPGTSDTGGEGPAVRVPLRVAEVARGLVRALGGSTRELPSVLPILGAAAELDVLLVEDHRVNQIVAARMLERLGHRVDIAQDGKEALERMATQDFDVVLMDCHMPVMDGLEATRAWRAQESGRHMPILALTASSATDEREACFGAGMDGFLQKPLTLESLARTLAGVPKRRRSGGWSLDTPS